MVRHGACRTAATIASLFLVCGTAEAAHFAETGTSSVAAAETLSISLVGTCNYDWESGNDTLTITADPGESLGDPVMLAYCYAAEATATVADPRHRAVGGVGGLTFSVNCPYAYSNPDPATIVLNPGAGQQTLVSIGPDTVNPGDPPYSVSDCDSVVAQIGDVIQSAGAVFAAVDGPATSTATAVTLTYSFEVELQPLPVPTVDRWGLLALALLVVASGVAAVGRLGQLD